MQRIAIIGCGNSNRTDDGVGPEVIARLRGCDLPTGVELYDAGTDGMAVIYRARDASHLIIVDARVPEGNPGTIYQVPGDELREPPKSSVTLHDFRWDHALYVGNRLYGAGFPETVTVFLVEALSTALGLGLTSPVSKAAETVTERILGLASDWSAAA